MNLSFCSSIIFQFQSYKTQKFPFPKLKSYGKLNTDQCWHPKRPKTNIFSRLPAPDRNCPPQTIAYHNIQLISYTALLRPPATPRFFENDEMWRQQWQQNDLSRICAHARVKRQIIWRDLSAFVSMRKRIIDV